LGEKILAQMPEPSETSTESASVETSKDKSTLVKIFEIVERMVGEGSDDKAILEAVNPLYKELGINFLKAKARIKTLREVIEIHNS
jgi:hypothetical protein